MEQVKIYASVVILLVQSSFLFGQYKLPEKTIRSYNDRIVILSYGIHYPEVPTTKIQPTLVGEQYVLPSSLQYNIANPYRYSNIIRMANTRSKYRSQK